MTDWLLPALAGFGTGILSAWGVGGGTLLLLLMTLFLGVDQTQAQGINLLYFLPTAGMSLLEHRKNGYLDREVMRAAIPLGTLAFSCFGRAPICCCIKEMRQGRTHCLIFHTKQVCTSSI